MDVKETSAGPGAWAAIDRQSPVYASEIMAEAPLGTLDANGTSGNLMLTARYGLAWSKAQPTIHNLVLKFEIGS